MAQKFVINHNRLIIGHVDSHTELVRNLIDYETIGGGWWFHDHENKTVYFYGRSITYGAVTEEEFNLSLKPNWLKPLKIVFSTATNIFDVVLNENLKNL
jgi:hypothetical protein